MGMATENQLNHSQNFPNHGPETCFLAQNLKKKEKIAVVTPWVGTKWKFLLCMC